MGDENQPKAAGREESDRYRRLVEESTDVATIVDTDGEITYVSPAITRVLGYDPDDLIGTTGYEHVHPDDRQRNAAALEAVVANPDESQSVEVRFRHTDGSWCWIEATMRNRLQDEVLDGILINSREVTERKEEQRKRRMLAEEYETLLNNAEDAIFFLKVDESNDVIFEFERLSPSYEQQTGITTESVRGKTPREVFGEQRGAELEANYHRCIRAREPVSYQEELSVSEGARIWQTILAPVITDGEITRLLGITRNVTERVERERRLRRQNERLDEFASVVSHDLRNPLNVATARATLLDEETESKHLPALLRALDRMEAIVEDTLTLARQGETIGETEAVRLIDIAGQCWATVDADGASLEVVDEATLQADPDRLQHVFENLFRNAVEHGSTGSQPKTDDAVEHGSTGSRSQTDDAVEHGSTSPASQQDAGEHGDSDVTIRVGELDDGTGFFVEDDGPGIPPQRREEIFEPGHSSASGGTGFGLTIAKRIAEAHDWDLQVTDGTDGGARFEFSGVDITSR